MSMRTLVAVSLIVALRSTAGSAQDWSLTGNAGTVSNGYFLGTTDATPLEIRVNGVPALRIAPHVTSPILFGGFSGNTVDFSRGGAFIGGGGRVGDPNRATNWYATVAGGLRNDASGVTAFVGGGYDNRASHDAVAAGGFSNYAAGQASAIGGGQGNAALNYSAVVPGGTYNQAGGVLSFAAGYQALVRGPAESGDWNGDEGTFMWSDGSAGPETSTGPFQFLIRSAGGVAINTNSPAAGSALTVSGNTTLYGNTIVTGNTTLSGTLIGAIGFGNTTRQMLNLYATAYGIGVQSYSFYSRSDSEFAWFRGGVHNNGTGNPGTGGTRQMRLDGNGNLFVRGTVNGGGADFAEMLPARDGVEPGDVLAIGRDGRLELTTEPYQDALAGVHSTKPALLGGAQDGVDLTGKVALAVSGIVPVKVTDENGPIAPGDLLTSSSTPGRAMKAEKIRIGGVAFYPSGVILGKSLQPHASGEGVIEALVILQ